MNKISFIAGICITIFALVGIVYTAYNPLVDTCAPPTEDGMRIASAVCARQESPNWGGINVSLAALSLGIALFIYSLKAQKK